MYRLRRGTALAVLLLLMLVGSCTAQEDGSVAAAKNEVDSITVTELQQQLAGGNNFVLLDIRTEAEHRAGHIPGARWVPRGMLEFVAMLDSLAPVDAEIVVYCKTDGRGALSAQTLKEIGYQSVSYVKGGYESWLAAGLPVDTGLSPVKFSQGVSMNLSSPVFEDGGLIPSKYTCDDADISPPLIISGTPESAVSLALICDDPDAPRGTWVHWVLYNLPPGTRELSEAYPTDANLPDGACQGISDFGRNGYGGPCPPSGTHRYFFKLYALEIGRAHV